MDTTLTGEFTGGIAMGRPERQDPMLVLALSSQVERLGEVAVLGRHTVVIGRDPSLTLFPQGPLQDRHLSRRHSELSLQGKSWMIRDLGSHNGTFVNGQAVEPGGRALVDGDVIRVGGLVLLYLVQPTDLISVPRDPESSMMGNSLKIRALMRQVRLFSSVELPVLILGESGVGKEHVARDLHRLGKGPALPFVAVNCAAIPRDLFESTLFGHEKGSFTGATERRRGLMEQASGGTLFLDEIGEMPLESQSKLLRALEEGAVMRLGSSKLQPVSVRLVAATRQDLTDLVRQGRFRDDLYARIAQAVLRIPSLRERREDIPLLMMSFLREGPLEARTPSSPAVEELLAHPWTLNVRELKSLTEILELEAQPDEGPLNLGPMVRERMRNYLELKPGVDPEVIEPRGERPDQARLEELLTAAGGNVSRVAKELGVHRFQVYRWMDRYGLRPRKE